MLTSSAKAKGRRAQDEVCLDLRQKVYLPAGCHQDDVKPVTMGLSGMDIILTPAARRVLDLVIECKNVEKLNIVGTFLKHHKQYEKHSGLKLLAHRRNHAPMMVTLMWADLINLLAEVTNARRT